MFGWGNTANGELGLGGTEEEHFLVPRKLHFSHAHNVVQVACGENHTVMVLNDGTVYTCGSNDVHQLGHNKSRKRPELVDSLEAHVIKLVACGANHSLVANEWGQIFSWGQDDAGQLGHGVTQETYVIPRMIRSLATKQVVQIACGAQHSMAIINTGLLYSWGNNQYGQLGIGMRSNQEHTPCLVKSLQGIPISQIACGSYHSIILSKSGAVFCWGKNKFGQLGLNDDINREYPSNLRALRYQKIKYICCGEDHTAALTKDGGVFTFGAGMYGQLGHNSRNNEIIPKKVLELMGSVVSQIACGRRHTLAYVPSRGRIYSFGLGGRGQLGNNSTRNCTTPIVVFGPWVPSSYPQNMEIDDDGDDADSPPLPQFVVYKIFTGGDHCFAKVTLLKDEIPPADYRIFDPETQILTLTESKAEEFVQVSDTDTVSQDLMSYIENVFSSPTCINASFLLSNDEHFGCNRNNPGVDLSQVQKVFTLISQVQNKVIQELILNCQEKELIPALTKSPPDVEALRLYLIFPECHIFHQPENCSIIICPFGLHLLNLKPEAGKIIESWWSKLNVSYFTNIINVYKNCIVYILELPQTQNSLENGVRSKQLDTCMKILAKLNQVNNEITHVPYDTFYISEITQKVDVAVDYIRWLQFGKLAQGDQLFFCDYPFLFDAHAKTLLLQTDADIQMQTAVQEALRRNFTSLFAPIDPTNPFLVLYVSRENIVEDTVRQLAKNPSMDFKKPLKVIFFGEEAVDAGGVRKEFFLLILKEIVDPKYGMFKEYETRNIWFNEQSFEDDVMYHLIGILCGLAIYNGIIIALPFPLALYKKLLKEKLKLDDLKDLTPAVVKSLHELMNYEDDDLEDIFMLHFEITRECFGEIITTELKPGGSEITVTKENRNEYVQLYVDFILNKSVEKQFQEFYNGFHKVCGGRILELFHSHELMAMVIGNEQYNWKEFEESTTYKGEFSKDHHTIRLFWKVFHALTIEEKKKFLLFLTGSDRIPILGMKSIKIIIQSTAGGENYFPVAHTCFNLLDLPIYTSEDQLRNKLLQAIEHTHGFALV